jgi:uncharacterized protein YdeI (YjbR/CyaY-like superfamily)
VICGFVDWMPVREMERDAASRKVALPPELQAGLAEDRRASAAFAGLPPSHQKAYVDFVDEANGRRRGGNE